MNPSFAFDELEVVAYSDNLSEEHLPHNVFPIFRHKEQNLYLFPPYRSARGRLQNAHVGHKAEFDDFVVKQEVTLIDKPQQAFPDYQLWVDLAFEIHYEPNLDAAQKQRSYAWAKTEEADQAFLAGDLAAAEEALQRALNVNLPLIETLVLKAAIRRLEHRELGVSLALESAKELCSEATFFSLVDLKIRAFHQNHPRHPVHNRRTQEAEQR